MARIPVRNEAVYWGAPPDPNHPAPAFPGISSTKFNPVEAERCYKETLKKEVEFRGLHQERNTHSNLPAFLGESRGVRKNDMIPGYTSVWATYEKLGWEEGLSGKLQPPELRPQSRRCQSAGIIRSKTPAPAVGEPPREQLRSRPSSASALRTTAPNISRILRDDEDFGVSLRIQDAAASEALLNAERMKGVGIRKLLRPASAPARDRVVVQAPRPNLQKKEEMADPNAWKSKTARHRSNMFFKERLHCKKLFKNLMNQPLTVS